MSEVHASQIALSLSRRSRPQVNGQRRKAKTGEGANEGAGDAEAGEPDMFGEAGSVAAE